MRFSLSLPRSVKTIVEPNQDTEDILSLVISQGGNQPKGQTETKTKMDSKLAYASAYFRLPPSGTNPIFLLRP